jgi:dienelactone hydrolase
MVFIRETLKDGVVERLFDLAVDGERVPGVLWTPEGAAGPRPLVLLGHGGSQHKRIGFLANLARRWVTRHGWAVAGIDAPGHGDRVSREEALALSRLIAERIAKGTPMGPEMDGRMAERIRRGGPEWAATLDFLQALPEVGAGKVGYFGVSMGTAIGLPFVASEGRIDCAVFGLAGLHLGTTRLAEPAGRVTCPVEFVFQWDDEIVSREEGLGLFNALGSRVKSFHANPGGHVAIPAFELESWERFFARWLKD